MKKPKQDGEKRKFNINLTIASLQWFVCILYGINQLNNKSLFAFRTILQKNNLTLDIHGERENDQVLAVCPRLQTIQELGWVNLNPKEQTQI